MSDSRVANRYARSLVTIAQENGILEDIHNDALAFLETCKQNRQVSLALSNPVVPQRKKLSIVDRIFGGQLKDTTHNFLKLVINHQRGELLVPIFKRVISQYKQIKGIVDAKVSSATSLKPEIQDQLKEIIKQIKNNNDITIELSTEQDQSLIGGFMLQFEDKLLDKSVASQLKNLRQNLK
jgi:F-type H+-transporting ATPase subunit delta